MPEQTFEGSETLTNIYVQNEVEHGGELTEIRIVSTGSNTALDTYSSQVFSGHIEKVVLTTQSVVNGSAWLLVSGTNEAILQINSIASGLNTAIYYPRILTQDTQVSNQSIYARASVMGPLYLGGSGLGATGSITAQILWSKP
jgi:hypothetical protein